jgi:hypothetical protein
MSSSMVNLLVFFIISISQSFVRFLEAINGLMVLNDQMRSGRGEEVIAKRVCVCEGY